MTDPFADLERELLAAHARDAQRGAVRRRLLPGLPQAMALTASVAAAALGLVWLTGVAAEGDPERAAAPQPAAEEGWTAYAPLSDDEDGGPEASCGKVWEPKLTRDPVPPELLDLMAVFRRPVADPDRAPLPFPMFASQAVRIYDAGRRHLAESEGGVYAWAADIVGRDTVATGHRPCDYPDEDVPGVCLAVLNGDEDSAISACFTPAEIRDGEAFIDSDNTIHGLAPDLPDDQRTFTIDFRGTPVDVDVSGNYFTAPLPVTGEPEAPGGGG